MNNFLKLKSLVLEAVSEYFLVWATVLMLLAVGWLVMRMVVSDTRHSLNHQNLEKDTFRQAVMAACPESRGKKAWIRKNDARYIPDRMATSNKLYRYVVLDGSALNNAQCVAAIVRAARAVTYSIFVSMADEKGKRIDLYFHNAND